MRSQTSGTCAYGLPGTAGYHLFERKRSALRQSSFARSRAAAPKRKMRDDSDDELDGPHHHVSAKPAGRVVVDEFGNRMLLDGLKRMRVASPPSSPVNGEEDVAMDENSNGGVQSIIPVASSAATGKVPTVVSPVCQIVKKFGSVPALRDEVEDPSCRAMVIFDPHHKLPIERSPRIQLVSDSEGEKGGSDSEPEEKFVRFEELPDDDEDDEAEAMELD